MLPTGFIESASLLERFRREAEVAARLPFPVIATVNAAGVEDVVPCIARAYVEDSEAVPAHRPQPRRQDGECDHGPGSGDAGA